MSLSILPLDQRIFNAQNWEFTLSGKPCRDSPLPGTHFINLYRDIALMLILPEFYIRRFCKLTTDGQPWPDFGNGP